MAAQSALKLCEEKFRKSFHLTADSMNFNQLDDGLYVSIHPGFSKIVGYDRSDVIERTSIALNIWVGPDGKERLIAGLMQQGTVTDSAAPRHTKLREIRYDLMSGTVIQLDPPSAKCSVQERKK